MLQLIRITYNLSHVYSWCMSFMLLAIFVWSFIFSNVLPIWDFPVIMWPATGSIKYFCMRKEMDRNNLEIIKNTVYCRSVGEVKAEISLASFLEAWLSRVPLNVRGIFSQKIGDKWRWFLSFLRNIPVCLSYMSHIPSLFLNVLRLSSRGQEFLLLFYEQLFTKNL